MLYNDRYRRHDKDEYCCDRYDDHYDDYYDHDHYDRYDRHDRFDCDEPYCRRRMYRDRYRRNRVFIIGSPRGFR